MNNVTPSQHQSGYPQTNASNVGSQSAAVQSLTKRAVQSRDAEVLADVYQEDVNIATWRRTTSPALVKAAQQLISTDHLFAISTPVTPENAFDSIFGALGSHNEARLISNDIVEIVSMYCCLFELDEVGLRLTTLDRAMCPKFHVDRVPCRLVTTYTGIATEWISHELVDRTKLGVGSQGKPDSESGLYRSDSDIQQLTAGDVALLKGESWPGNEGAGLVHRSPQLANQGKRLLLTLDFI